MSKDRDKSNPLQTLRQNRLKQSLDEKCPKGSYGPQLLYVRRQGRFPLWTKTAFASFVRRSLPVDVPTSWQLYRQTQITRVNQYADTNTLSTH